MTPDRFHAAALALPGATYDVKWGDHRTYCVGGKMFAMAGAIGEAEPRYGFKGTEMSAELLVEQGLAEPMPYLQRAKWVRLAAFDALPDRELLTYLAQAHAIIAAGLTKKARAALGIE